MDKLHVLVKKFIREKGFTCFTDAQSKAIPEILEGHNILLISSTGSGKTEAACLPIFTRIIELKESKKKPLFGLYITPLRALNRDLLNRLDMLGNLTGISIAARHGDTPQSQRLKQTKNPPDFLITTPETLQIILTAKKFREHLKNVRFVVIDEIHELADNKRGIQLVCCLERLKLITKYDFQRICLSATVGSAEKVSKFIQSTSKPVKIISTESTKKYDITVDIPKIKKFDSELGKKLFVSKEIAAAIRQIQEINEELRNKTSKYSTQTILTFVNTRQTAEILSSRLMTMDKLTAVHHSSISKTERIKAEKGFKNGEIKHLISTSSMELGIDIGHVDLVIQFNSPRQASKLTQRIGRAGHREKDISKGIIISTSPEDAIESAVISKNTKNYNIEPTNIYTNCRDVMANQIIGLLIEYKTISIDRLFLFFKGIYPYNNIDMEFLTRILELLQKIGLIWINNNQIKLRRSSWKHYYTNISTIPDQKTYSVKNILNNSEIGKLDEEFVVSNLTEGMLFICAGRPWKSVSIEEDTIIVEPVSRFIGKIPSWEGELIPVEFMTAQEVASLRKSIKEKIDSGNKKELIKWLKSEYNLTQHASEIICEFIKKCEYLPAPNEIYIEKDGDKVVINCCFGSKTNETFGIILSTFLSLYLHTHVQYKSDPYRILLTSPKFLEKHQRSESSILNLIEECFRNIIPEKIEIHLRSVLENTHLFRWRFINVAKRFGILGKDYDIAHLNLPRLIELYKNTVVYEETLNELFHDKLDVFYLKDIANKIKDGKIFFNLRDGKLSFLSSQILPEEKEEYRDPETQKEIIKLFKERIMSQQVELFCMHCKKYHTTFHVRNAPETIKCPVCDSIDFAIGTKDDMKKYREIYNKEKLSKKDREFLNKIMLCANLYHTYGKKAIIALSAFGVGPKTAARLLSKPAKRKDDFYITLLEAEKLFFRTRKYW